MYKFSFQLTTTTTLVMFTPPPSPIVPTGVLPSNSTKSTRKKTYIRFATFFFPMLAIASTTTYLLHHNANDPPPPPISIPPILPLHLFLHQKQHREQEGQQLQQHRHQARQTTPTTTTKKSTTTTSSPQIVPTVPSSPPVLPTPFPQPLDSGLAQNFSSSSCASFFANMTSAASFRTCRPFSLLLATSGSFINAQTNLTLLNSIIWGTCNTPTPYDQCKQNMHTFSLSLQQNCAQELKNQNILITDTLIGLQSFSTFYATGCLADPSIHTYCYLTSALSQNPFDLFVYSLPLGLPVPPKSSTPSCSACSKSIMSVYADVIREKSDGYDVLLSPFNAALQMCTNTCGQDFAMVGASLKSSSSASSRGPVSMHPITSFLLLLFFFLRLGF